MLTSYDLDDMLPKLGWVKTEGRGEEKKTREYIKSDITIYVKQRVTKERKSVKLNPLVVHSNNEKYRKQINSIEGVSLGKAIKNSNLGKFPKSIEDGVEKSEIGIDVAVDNIDALKTLLDFLTGKVETVTDIAAIYDQNIAETEKSALIKVRLGQGKFRDDLAKIHSFQCQLSYVDKLDLLRASHIKPWSKCDNHAERLDSDNGLLLAIQYDLLFDKGYISFQDDGSILISDIITDKEREIFQLNENMQITMQSSKQKAYMKYHREQIFLKQNSSP